MFLARMALASPFALVKTRNVPADIPEAPEGSPEFWFKLMISMCLVLAGGVFAGCVTSWDVDESSY
jgi:metal transporter CNNM